MQGDVQALVEVEGRGGLAVPLPHSCSPPARKPCSDGTAGSGNVSTTYTISGEMIVISSTSGCGSARS